MPRPTQCPRCHKKVSIYEPQKVKDRLHRSRLAYRELRCGKKRSCFHELFSNYYITIYLLGAWNEFCRLLKAKAIEKEQTTEEWIGNKSIADIAKELINEKK